MAKKVAVPDGDGQIEKENLKKKRNRCCTCCLAFLIVIVVIFGAAFGVGWYFGDKFTKENFGMSLGDSLGVINDLYWTDDKDVVKNSFKPEDVDGFYSQIKRNILLKDDAEVDFDAALLQALDKYLETVGGTESAARNSGAEPEGDAPNGENPDGDQNGDDKQSSVMDLLIDMIANVLDRDNIDLDRLNAYDATDPTTDEYIFKLNDKQLAAFINSIMKAMLKNADKISALGETPQMINLASVVSLKQVRFVASTVKAEDGTQTVAATSADVTVWLGFQRAAGQAVTYFMKNSGVGWASGLARWLGDVFLPENLYVTMSVPLLGDGTTKLVINDMNASEHARASKLINGILKMSGTSTLDELLVDLTEKIKPYLKTATEHMDFTDAPRGELDLDLLETVTKLASENMEGEPLTKSDLIYVLQALLSDPSAQLKKLQPYFYKNRYLAENGDEVYIEGGSATLAPIDYERRFIEEIESKYALDFGDSEDVTLENVLAMLGVSLDGQNSSVQSKDLLDLINADKFTAALDKDLSELELAVTDRMLAAALSSQTDKLLTGAGTGLEGLKITLDALTFVRKDGDIGLPEQQRKLYALIAVEVDTSDLLASMGSGSLAGKLAAGLMPEKLLLTVTVDITRNRPAGATADETEFMINSCENTQYVIATLEKLIPNFNLNTVSEKMESMLNNMLDELYKKLNIRLVASTVELDGASGEYTGEQGGMIMPDIFTVVTDTVLVREDGTKVVEPSGLKNVLRALNDTDGFSSEPQIAEDYGAFIDQVIDKYYLNPAPTDDLSDFDRLTQFMSDFDMGKFRVSGADGTIKYLAHDTRATELLKPKMTAAELGALLSEQLSKQGNESVASYRINDVSTSPTRLSIVLSIAVGDLLPPDMKFLLSSDDVFVTAQVKLDEVTGDGEIEPKRYGVDVGVNNMPSGGEVFPDMVEIVKFFNPDFDIESQVQDFGRILYEQLNSLNKSIGSESNVPDDIGGITVGKGGNLFEFTVDGLEMIDFYTFLAGKMDLTLDETTTADTVKSALQGMYQYVDVEGLRNANNYKLSDVIRNAPSATDAAWSDDQYKDMVTRGGVYSDTNFNGFIKRGVESIDKDGSVRAVQTAVLNKGDDSQNAQNARTWANERLAIAETLTENDSYMFVTFSMTMNKFMETDKADSVEFYPETVYATIVYKKTDDPVKPFDEIGLIFNDMTAAEYDVLVKLMSLSADSTDKSKVNIVTIAERSEDVLNNLVSIGEVSFGGMHGGTGFGSVVFTPKSI